MSEISKEMMYLAAFIVMGLLSISFVFFILGCYLGNRTAKKNLRKEYESIQFLEEIYENAIAKQYPMSNR